MTRRTTYHLAKSQTYKSHTIMLRLLGELDALAARLHDQAEKPEIAAEVLTVRNSLLNVEETLKQALISQRGT